MENVTPQTETVVEVASGAQLWRLNTLGLLARVVEKSGPIVTKAVAGEVLTEAKENGVKPFPGTESTNWHAVW